LSFENTDNQRLVKAQKRLNSYLSLLKRSERKGLAHHLQNRLYFRKPDLYLLLDTLGRNPSPGDTARNWSTYLQVIHPDNPKKQNATELIRRINQLTEATRSFLAMAVVQQDSDLARELAVRSIKMRGETTRFKQEADYFLGQAKRGNLSVDQQRMILRAYYTQYFNDHAEHVKADYPLLPTIEREFELYMLLERLRMYLARVTHERGNLETTPLPTYFQELAQAWQHKHELVDLYLMGLELLKPNYEIVDRLSAQYRKLFPRLGFHDQRVFSQLFSIFWYDVYRMGMPDAMERYYEHTRWQVDVGIFLTGKVMPVKKFLNVVIVYLLADRLTEAEQFYEEYRNRLKSESQGMAKAYIQSLLKAHRKAYLEAYTILKEAFPDHAQVPLYLTVRVRADRAKLLYELYTQDEAYYEPLMAAIDNLRVRTTHEEYMTDLDRETTLNFARYCRRLTRYRFQQRYSAERKEQLRREVAEMRTIARPWLLAKIAALPT